MHPALEPDHDTLPVTALAFVRLELKNFLLSGQGPSLNVYDVRAQRLYASKKIFDVENIHGIKVRSHEHVVNPTWASQEILIWTGSSICLASIEGQDDTVSQAVLIIKLVSKVQTDHRIQDVCFRPSIEADSSIFNAVFLTSHNVLYGLSRRRMSDSVGLGEAEIQLIAVGPPSLLYCAHILWPASGRGLVAAGTVFGNVSLWSFPSLKNLVSSNLPIPHRLHCTLRGHNGSVFGVQISDPSTEAGFKPGGRYVASCSDDRTIRVWDVSGWDDVESEDDADHNIGRHGHQVASVMGHKSRIWGIRFLDRSDKSIRLLSYGEDCSTQIWRFNIPTDGSGLSPTNFGTTLRHESTYVYHTGKNIWAVDILNHTGQTLTIASGGADGRVVSYTLNSQSLSVLNGHFVREYSMKAVQLQLEADLEASHSRDETLSTADNSWNAKAIFAELNGEWRLVRSLKSAIPAYPSGTFDGFGTFCERTPTDPDFNCEYLYREEGTFTTEQGLNFSAKRRYVYRLNQERGQISVWFVKPGDDEAVDYLFHTLDVKATAPARDKIKVKAHHLCVEDDYWVDYVFGLETPNLRGFSITYTVKGPDKEYIAHARYRREPESVVDEARLTSTGSSQTVEPKCQSIAAACGKSIASKDSFRTYTWITEGSFLVATDHGWLLQGSFDIGNRIPSDVITGNNKDTSLRWTSIIQEPDIGSACIMTRADSAGLVFITGRDGRIYCFQDAAKSFVSLTKLPYKVACLKISSLNLDEQTPHHEVSAKYLTVFAACLGSPVAYHLQVEQGEQVCICNQVQLILPTNFITTSSLFIPLHNVLILGFRNGALAVYDLSDENRPLISELITTGTHGSESVTTIVRLSSKSTSSPTKPAYLLTAGKDGRYAVHLLTNFDTSAKRVDLQTVHTCNLPFGPVIEGATLDEQSQDLYLWGFRGMEFVVWNDSWKREVMSVNCGGPHRNLEYLPLEHTGGGGNLVWTKASTTNVYSQREASHVTMKYGGHGREIKAISLSPPIEGHDCSAFQYLATGAEDTTIRIFKISLDPDEARYVTILSRHTTGIQEICWSSDSRQLFSAGGREELFVWQVQPVPYIGIGVICLAQCPPVTESGDLRIMGIDVINVAAGKDSAATKYILAAVYSDSTLRIFLYDPVDQQSPFEIVSLGQYTGHCLTKVSFVRLQSHLHCCTASTDGHITLWPLNVGSEFCDEDPRNTWRLFDTSLGSIRVSNDLAFSVRFQVHQSSINGMSILNQSNANILITTVGDDGALAFSRVTELSVHERDYENRSNSSQRLLPSPSSTTHSTLVVPKAHASAVDALTYLGLVDNTPEHSMGYRFATCGKDQRLKWWRVSIDLEQSGTIGFMVVREGDTPTSIADLSSLESMAVGEKRNSRVVVAGIGMEVRGRKSKTA